MLNRPGQGVHCPIPQYTEYKILLCSVDWTLKKCKKWPVTRFGLDFYVCYYGNNAEYFAENNALKNILLLVTDWNFFVTLLHENFKKTKEAFVKNIQSYPVRSFLPCETARRIFCQGMVWVKSASNRSCRAL